MSNFYNLNDAIVDINEIEYVEYHGINVLSEIGFKSGSKLLILADEYADLVDYILNKNLSDL
jgi:hypothetical protein